MGRIRLQLRKAFAAQAIAVAVVASTGAVFALGAGTANAALDDTKQIETGDNLTIEARQSDTDIRFVAPLDGNPLTREWFHDAIAGFHIDGAGADEFLGKITIGYQIGYPATLSGQIKFSYTSPTLSLGLGLNNGPTVGNLVPTVGVEISAGFGPGIKSVDIATVAIAGADGWIKIAGVHGTVTGVVGRTTIRPYVTVTSVRGDTVTTYGKDWKA
ncbi:MspA family porin [Aldersonia kunmingensis]|uniref:MspA family porin n=1 Tax=Aldersonia kunmingensis TaxID=408066 RepID=UPI0008366F69|nr:MspA family porin [Aldersonia kunmingensis]